jgi:hypothetical protein
MAMLAQCLAEAEDGKDAYLTERLGELHGFFITMANWYDQLFALPTSALRSVMKLGGVISGLLPKAKE